MAVSLAPGQDMRVAYDRAAKHLPAQASKLSLNATIAPVWIKGQDRFVYRRQLAGQAKEFVLIDANANSSDVAFDHERLAAAITTKGQAPVDPRRLPFDRVEVTPQTLEFQWNQKTWTCTCLNTVAPRRQSRT